MLPFLKPKTVAGLIISHRKSDATGKQEPDSTEGNEDSALDACSADLIRAFTSKDAKAVSSALRAAWEILDSPEQSEEGENDFESMNQLAAQKGE